MRFSKIFGIGLPRTGTTSLSQALNRLDISCVHFPFELYNEGVHSSLLRQNSAFVDAPIPMFYKDLDTKYPRSGFILTKRPLDDWMRSMEWLLSEGKQVWPWKLEYNKYHEEFFGASTFNADLYRDTYESFHLCVTNYFATRDDFLVLDLAKGYGYEELCSFLDVPLCVDPYPKGNPSRNARILQKVATKSRFFSMDLERKIRHLDHYLNRMQTYLNRKEC